MIYWKHTKLLYKPVFSLLFNFLLVLVKLTWYILSLWHCFLSHNASKALTTYSSIKSNRLFFMSLSFWKFIIHCNTRQKTTKVLDYTEDRESGCVKVWRKEEEEEEEGEERLQGKKEKENGECWQAVTKQINRKQQTEHRKHTVNLFFFFFDLTWKKG